MSDIFISYARSTATQAHAVAECLRALGYNVWRDDELPAHRAYAEVIEERLLAAKAVIVLWSADAAKSEWVQSEADRARASRKLVQMTLDGAPLPMPFDRIQCADLTGWSGDAHASGWRKIVASVEALVAGGIKGRPAVAVAAPVPVPARPSGRRPTLAILPFVNRSGEAADDVFAEDMVEDIIGALSLGRGLRVIARGTTAAYHNKVIDARTIGAELGTDYVMEGNLRRIGEALRVTAQLVDGQSGAILWTHKFDRPVTDLARLQDRLIVEIAGNLTVQIQRIEMDRAIRKPGDLTAYEAVKRSWAAIPKMTANGLKHSIAEARKALALAPGYALAESTLALTLGVLYQRHGSCEPELLAEALVHVDRALELNENHGTVLFHVALVMSYAMRWQESLQFAERSVELNPNMPDARHTLGGIYTRYERYDEAIEQLDEADRLAPRGFTMSISLMNRCWAQFGAERLELALEAADRLMVIMPSDRTGLMLHVVILAGLGETARACKCMAELRKVAPNVSLDTFLNIIRVSRQADRPRARNAELFGQIWNETPLDQCAAKMAQGVTA